MGSPAPETPEPRSRLRLLGGIAGVALVAVLIGLFVQRILAEGSGSNLVSAVKAGAEPAAPGFDLDVLWDRSQTWPRSARATIADGRLALNELRGKPVVVNFWASWCVPCKAEAPRLVAAARRHAGNVLFLGLNVQDVTGDARRFLERYGTNYPSVRDGGDSIYQAYGLTGLPETFYLDPDGRVLAHSIGEVSPTELEANVRKASDE